MSRRKLISFHMVSLDGYHEDARRSLDWAAIDEEFDEHSISQLNDMGGLVFGRRTYEGMVSYWTGPGATDSPEIARRMTVLPKVVVSTTLTDPGWENTRVLGDRIAEEIAAMKEVDGDGKDLAVFGSSTLTASLLDEGLVDEVRVVVLPVLLGAGSTLLAGGHGVRALELVRATTFRSGNVLACYRPVT